jgi:hypothetical protein
MSEWLPSFLHNLIIRACNKIKVSGTFNLKIQEGNYSDVTINDTGQCPNEVQNG